MGVPGMWDVVYDMARTPHLFSSSIHVTQDASISFLLSVAVHCNDPCFAEGHGLAFGCLWPGLGLHDEDSYIGVAAILLTLHELLPMHLSRECHCDHVQVEFSFKLTNGHFSTLAVARGITL